MPAVPGEEVLISVDIEASGPSPGTGSLVSLGACLVERPDEAFYVEVRPIPGLPWDDATEQIHGLSREHLSRAGTDPAAAMRSFADWIEGTRDGRRPVFAAFNAAFDWMFVADYFHRFLGSNPFGISALDQKAYFMAKHDVPVWSGTVKAAVRRHYPTAMPHTHHALDDAREQAELMMRLLQR
ncbi:MAG: 3'-5' exonuclease [Chloroflexi bacterium]|nr:3'-5' exonuclease [Chloroflexota bacterium]